jgi:uncharacterized membrane protein
MTAVLDAAVLDAIVSTNIPAALTGAFAIGMGTVITIALLLLALASRINPGGVPVTQPQRRWRLILGVLCIAAAAIVGVIGYLKLSLEPAVDRQIPYLASAGMALVVLSAVGGSLLVAEQLRGDDQRLDELEAAVRHLADALAPTVEAPARRATPPE